MRARGRTRQFLAAGAALLGVLVFTALGVWQLQRREWKLELIDRVAGYLSGTPTAAPGPYLWPLIGAVDEYRRVRVTGRYLNDEETLVQALTERGAGYWVMTPLLAKGGFTVLVNRGFVPADRNTAASRSAGMVMGDTTVSGLLRLSEPHGGFLHVNQPAAGRWYSRDVPAMAASLQLHNVAPYFIDADAAANAGGFPVGGLTVVSFRNQHLQYALTWFSLAILSVVGAMVVARQG